MTDSRTTEAVAWMAPDGRVIDSKAMETAKRSGGATLSAVAPYTIPLYASAPEPSVHQDDRIEAWDVVWRALHRMPIDKQYGTDTGIGTAIAEIRRLQALESSGEPAAQYIAPTYTCVCGVVDEFNVFHCEPDEVGAVYPVIECRVCGQRVADYRGEDARQAARDSALTKVEKPPTLQDLYPGTFKPGCVECAGMGCDACYTENGAPKP